jgi:GTP-binding protein EngB required for normal cell division
MQIKSATFIKGVRGTDDIVTDGIPQIAFVGRSNVGKSSVIIAFAIMAVWQKWEKSQVKLQR